MGLREWTLPELCKNLIEIGRLVRVSEQEMRSSLPEIKSRGEMQRPILSKVHSILEEELDCRLGDEEERFSLHGTIEGKEQQEERAAMLEKDHPGALEDSGADHPRLYDVMPTSPGTADDPILRAMKNAAWHSLQRIGTDVLVKYLKLWIKKHHDYGPENHAIWGCQGAIIRASDKLLRLKRSYFDEVSMENETIEDTWLDLIGYGLIGLVIERGLWPSLKLHTMIETMKAEERDTPKPTLQCPSCGSFYIDVYRAGNLDGDAGFEWCRCGMECRRCNTKIIGALHVGVGEALETAVQRGIADWKAQHKEEAT